VKKTKIIGIILILAGVLALVYGSFSVTRETHEAKIGPLELTVKDKENIKVPNWASIISIVAGIALLLPWTWFKSELSVSDNRSTKKR